MEEEISIINGELEEYSFNSFLLNIRNNNLFENLEDYEIKDIYDIYYSKKYLYLDGNTRWENILNKLDKKNYKFLTNNDIDFTEKIVMKLCEFLDLFYQDEKEEKEEKDENSNKSGNKGLNDSNKEEFDELMSKAFEEIDDLVEEKNEEQNGTSKINIKSNSVTDKSVENLLNKVKFSSSTMDSFITKTIKSFKQHFSNISRFEYEEILDSDLIEDIDGVEYLPLVKDYPVLWSEVFNIKKILSCVVDCYVDRSGSMSSNCNINEYHNSFAKDNKSQPSNISYYDLAKVLAYKLYKSDYLSDLYWFTTYFEKINLDSFLKTSTQGGTSIDCAIENVLKQKRPSLIISDGDDTINIYSDMVYIINVSPDCYFRMISKNTEAVRKMLQNKQIIGFIDNKFFLPDQFKTYASKRY
jgi:hypothetical protein